MFHRRGGRPGPYLVWRIRLLGLAMVLALLGIGTGLDWVINVAIGVALVGFLLRFFGGPSEEEEGDGDGGPPPATPADDDPGPDPPNPR